MDLKELSTANFDEEIKEGITLVDFWAPWCGPCRLITPSIEALAEEMPDVSFTKLNVDKSRQIAIKYNVMSIPTIIIFKDGEVKDTTIGVIPKDAIKGKIKAVM